MGRIKKVTRPAAAEGTTRTDDNYNIIKSTNQYEVGGDPFAMSSTDGKGATTGFTNDGLHRLQNVTQSTGGTSMNTKYTYNLYLQLLKN